MTQLIASLDLDEVSLVRDPANPEARVALFKTGGPMKEDKTEELTKELDPAMDKAAPPAEDMLKMDPMAAEVEDPEDEEVDIAKMKTDMEALQAAYDNLDKAVQALGFSYQNGALEKAANVEYLVIEGERIAKSSVPAAILKALESKDAEIRKSVEERTMADLRKRAGETFPHLKGTLDQRAALLKSLETMPEGVRKEMMESLKAADQAMAKVYGEEGKSPASDEMKDPEATLNKMVDDFAKANSMSFYKADAAVLKTAEGKALLKQIDKE